MTDLLDVRKLTVRFGGLNISDEDLLKVQRIVITACGTSWHAALVGKFLVEQLARIPVEVDLAPIAEGQVIKVFWRGKPIYISHRTKKQIEAAQNVQVASLPDPEPDSERVKAGHDQWLVVIGICTHLGCIPKGQAVGDYKGEFGGWFCPCHGSQYDTAGRIRKGPAPANLAIPPYKFTEDKLIRIG